MPLGTYMKAVSAGRLFLRSSVIAATLPASRFTVTSSFPLCSVLVAFTLICFGLASRARFSDAHSEQQQFQTPLEYGSI
jgi:hypothetical protein